MWQKIQQAPILGNGFGASVTFTTDDPRARAIYTDGTWTTTSMEWGWLEIWMKMGILGPIGFLVLFFAFVRSALLYRAIEHTWMGTWILASLVFLFATHFFSPYLNHPIGLGTILLFWIFLPSNRPPTITIPVWQKEKMPKQAFAPSPTTSQSRLAK
jgi:hypothetical protein